MESCTSKPSPSTGPPRLVLLAALLAWSFQAGLARAHPISLTQAFVFVTREKATVKLDCFAEDLFLFHNLAPNDRDFLEPDVIHRGIEQHREFLLERFTIRDVRGERLNGRFVYVESPEMPAEGIRLADLMAHRVSFQVEYLFEAPPEFLTFSQDLVGDKLVVPAEVQLNVKQETAAAPSQEVLYPGKPYTLRFNWDSPRTVVSTFSRRSFSTSKPVIFQASARGSTMNRASYSLVRAWTWPQCSTVPSTVQRQR
jgi:hypothetical protein